MLLLVVWINASEFGRGEPTVAALNRAFILSCELSFDLFTFMTDSSCSQTYAVPNR